MSRPVKTFWPTAHNYAEAVQYPPVCFAEPSLKRMLPAVDRLGMPLVTSGQFAYVFKLNPEEGGESLAVRCFRGFLGDREERYRAIDAHLRAHPVAALPRFDYLPDGILVAGQRYPVLVMPWVEGPTLDSYVAEVLGKAEVLGHLADEWVRMTAELRAAGVAHGDLQHGNIIVEHGRLRLVDLDGMYVPALAGRTSSEVGHQHYQHPRRTAELFSAEMDNFSALVVYLSLIALAERPSLWAAHHDENLLLTRADFLAPERSPLLAEIRELGPEPARLAAVLAEAARAADPATAPPLSELVSVRTGLPSWMSAPPEVEVAGRTREVRRAEVFGQQNEGASRAAVKPLPTTPHSSGVQSIFGQPASAPTTTPPAIQLDPHDLRLNTIRYAQRALGSTFTWLWLIPLHNVLLNNIWASFGIVGLTSLVATLLLLALLYLLYGLARALHLAETAPPSSQLPPAPPPPPQRRVPAGLYTASPLTAAGLPHAATGAHTPPRPTPILNPVVANRSLMIYHLPNCVWAEKIPARRRQDFTSPVEAQAAGFRPCRVCTP